MSNIVRFGLSKLAVAVKGASAVGKWAASTKYAQGAYVVVDGNVYKATTGGTSSSTAPTWATSGTVTDGTVTWTYISADSGYGIPIMIPGANSLDISTEGKSTTEYRDNGPYYSSYPNGGYSGTLQVARLPEEVMTAVYGWYIDTGGKVVEVADAKAKNVALLYEIEGDGDGERYAFYNVAMGRPSSKESTTSDSISLVDQSIDVTMSQTTLNGKKVIKSHCTADGSDYASWYDAVQIPKDAAA
jgi:phi13 family phage major tail protein